MQRLLRGVRPLKSTGNKRKDAANRRALKSRISSISRQLKEIERLIANPVKIISLSNPSLNLSKESSKIHKSIRGALKVGAKSFPNDSKAASVGIRRLLALLI
jgi:hypothetical protein